MTRLLIKGGSIVSMDAAIKDLPQGDVLVDNGRIAAIAPMLAADNAEIIDARGMIVLPGLINAHVHTWQSALRGIAGDWTVGKYMQAMHGGLAGHFRPEDVQIANLMGALNALNSGTTTLVDWCHVNRTPDHTDAAIDGLAASGARALFLHGSPKPDAKPGERHYSEIPMPRAEIERLRKGRFAGNDGLVTLGLAILGPSYSTREVTVSDVHLARDFGLIASMHVGGGIVMQPDGFQRLLDDGLIGGNFNIVHGNDMAHELIRALAGKGAQFTSTAEIELQMGYGDPLTGVLQACGSPMSIGTDVEPASRGDMFSAMRTTLQHERHRRTLEILSQTGSRPLDIPVTCRQALEWATINGARMAGLDAQVGSLTPGKQADIVLLRADDLAMFPVTDAIVSAVMQGGVASVDAVLVAGRIVKRDGRLLYGALAEKKAALRQSSERILTDSGLLPRNAA
ncbi:MAG: amidohydrolase family protein [Hyphomicrobiales bacterium]|nr:amidohydrolase family protein [Hyphomicrobiales bacterium]